jgi:SH3-like domain-containing protein
MTIGFFDVGMATQALDGQANKAATRHPFARGRRLAMQFETCLTDAHLDDKTMLSTPMGSRPSSPRQFRRRVHLISVGKSWMWQRMQGLSHNRSVRCRPRALTAALLLVFAQALVGPTGLCAQGTPAPANGASGLPVPRFVSLKADRVNLRQGPGTEYPTAWVFRRAGLPVEVIKEFESWRQVRDAEGTTGWVLGSMLSGRRTAVILPWEVKAGQGQQSLAVLRDDNSERAGAVAQVEAGVLANIITCDGKWCRVSVGGFRGYIEQAKLWGAYKEEVIK